ncbi:hypothetical protein Lepto7375DRAFT_7446 [Leptolyngbya sp. PCC 7375]|nr:hypothetical protein Lepto7375DRAFT_7446 [Leptolyngbya sp. PCC 7375]
MNIEELLTDIHASLQRWDADISTLKGQISQLQKTQASLCDRIDQIQPCEDWQPLCDVYKSMGHDSLEAARQALRKGVYRSGREYQKRSRKYYINLRAIEGRWVKEQSRRKVV